MKAIQLLTLALIVALLALMGGCKGDDLIPAGTGLGGSAISKYVAVGNSLTAGFQSNGLYESAQIYSFPNLIAGQLNAAGASLGSFQQPIWSDPGSYGANGKASRYELISLVGPIVGPRGLAPGALTNLALARPYDNLGIPGAVLEDFLDTTDFQAKSLARANPFFAAVLRQPALGKSVLQQVTALNPGVVTFWLGNNNVLGFATSGGVSPSSPTATTTFSTFYSAAISSLRAALPNAKILVATIPDVTAIPFFTTVGPSVRPLIPAGVWLRYQKHGNSGVSFDSTRFSESTPPMLCLTGSAYASYLGKPSGKWYTDNHYPALPAGIDTTLPFGFHPQNPWPDALVLDAGEQATAAAAIAAFNQTIFQVAAANNAAVVDINAFFNGVKANGYSWAGEKFTTDYITGGLFSLDGVHPSSRGHGILANQFIKTLNEKFGMNVTYVNLSAIPGIPAGISKAGGGIPSIPLEAFDEFKMLWNVEP
jgi:hypothetical protein